MKGVNLLRVLTSTLLASEGFHHTFFSRHGGVSQAPYATMNVSLSVGDATDAVGQNLEIAAKSLGISIEKLFTLSQIHGTKVQVVTAGDRRERVCGLQGDALIAYDPGVACGVLTADCVPILLADRRSGAVGAVHAGWRGAVAGVVRSTVDALRSSLSGTPSLIAAVGPHISVAAFEIGEEVAALMEAAAPGVDVVSRTSGSKPHGDLSRLISWQLTQLGVEQVERIPGCTFHEPERFFSFRRDGARSGRHLSAICVREPK